MEFDIIEQMKGLTALGTAWVLWLLIILSIVSVAIMIERLVFFSRIRLDMKEFTSKLTKLLVEDDHEGLEKLCKESPAPESQVALQAFENRTRGPQAIRESMEGYLIGTRPTLDRYLVFLGTLGNNAPFIGLFGTVIGIMMAFAKLSMNTAGGAEVVMAEISEALIATAVGLLVAIPAVITFNAFNRVVKRKVSNTEAIIKLVSSHFAN